MTCGQPYGNHCYGVHCELQFCEERFRGGESWQKKVAERRAVRMAQMGWSEDETPSPEQQNSEATAVAVTVARRYGLIPEES